MQATLSHYRILEQIGAGGMGVVYRAHDERLDRNVALKVLPAGALADESARKRFHKEALALSKLNHPNIATIFDFDTEDGTDFLVEELIEGLSLDQMLISGPLPDKEIINLGSQLCDALAAAHEQGIIHRDLKPANIRVTPEARVKILDFGLAKMARRASPAEPTASLTETQAVCGTLPYMAPEQLLNEKLDARTDIWSAGCVLYEMAAGQRPFGGSGPALSDAILHQPTPPPSKLKPTLAARLEDIILRCLEKKPERRYQSVRELRADLDRLSAPAAILPIRGRRRSRKTIDSVAVLPFENASADAEMEYLSDGITETIINTLSQLPKLRVMARSTTFRYKNRTVDPQTVGSELKVGAVLTGRVVQRGDRLTIGTELVDVTNGWQLWGEQYNRKLADVFALQQEIAEEISQNLRIQLSREERKRLAKRFTENAEAYQLYLKGRYCWNKWTPDGYKKAVDYFEQSIKVDPDYTLAYAGLADAYASLGAADALGLSPGEGRLKAKQAALRALELDDTLAEAHCSLALSKLSYDWEWSAAEREFKRALELNPNSVNSLHWYSHLLLALLRMEESLAAGLRMSQLSPLDPEMDIFLAFYYTNARQYDAVIERCRQALHLDPDFHEAHWFLGLAYAQQGMYVQATMAEENAVALSGNGPMQLAELGRIYGLAGQRNKAENVLAELTRRSRVRRVSSYNFALVYAGMDEKDRAVESLEAAYEERSSWMPYLRTEPRFDSLRSVPRFEGLLRRMNFPEPSSTAAH